MQRRLLRSTLAFSFFAAWVSMAMISGCSDTPTPTNPGPVVQKPDSVFYYSLSAQHLKPLPDGEQYVLWLKYQNDTAWGHPVPLFYRVFGPNDSVTYSNSFVHHGRLDTIVRALISVDPSKLGGAPASPLIAGSIDTVSNSGSLSASDPEGIGDYTSAAGSALFTTAAADTNRAKSEFYLMQGATGKYTSSMTGLPSPRKGWVYGLWVINPNYFPVHQFFYGWFRDASTPDSDPSNNAYPFPGGYKPNRLDDPGASLSVRLEPEFAVPAGAGAPAYAPSPYVVLSLSLHRFLNYGESIAFTNVSASNRPSGSLRLFK